MSGDFFSKTKTGGTIKATQVVPPLVIPRRLDHKKTDAHDDSPDIKSTTEVLEINSERLPAEVPLSASPFGETKICWIPTENDKKGSPPVNPVISAELCDSSENNVKQSISERVKLFQDPPKAESELRRVPSKPQVPEKTTIDPPKTKSNEWRAPTKVGVQVLPKPTPKPTPPPPPIHRKVLETSQTTQSHLKTSEASPTSRSHRKTTESWTQTELIVNAQKTIAAKARVLPEVDNQGSPERKRADPSKPLPTKRTQPEQVQKKRKDINYKEVDEDNLYKALQETFLAFAKKNESLYIQMYENEGSTILPHKYSNELYSLTKTAWHIILNEMVIGQDGGGKPETLEITRKSLVKLSYSVMKFDERLKNCASQLHRPDECLRMGNAYHVANMPIHAVLSFYVTAEIFYLRGRGKDEIAGIEKCTEGIMKAIENKVNLPDFIPFVSAYILPLTNKIRKHITDYEGEHDDREFMVLSEARCLKNFGLCFSKCGCYPENLELNHVAIDLMKRVLKDRAQHFKIYGICQHNAGSAHYNLKQYDQALKQFESALATFQNAKLDWKNESEKHDRIEATENILQDCKRHIPRK